MGVGLVWFGAMAHLNSNGDGVSFVGRLFLHHMQNISSGGRHYVDVSLAGCLWSGGLASWWNQRVLHSIPPADDCR